MKNKRWGRFDDRRLSLCVWVIAVAFSFPQEAGPGNPVGLNDVSKCSAGMGLVGGARKMGGGGADRFGARLGGPQAG